MKIEAILRDTLVGQIAGKSGHDKVLTGTQKALRRAIVLVERHHKRKEWVRGSEGLRDAGGRLDELDTHPSKLTVRTGHLLKSYTRRIVDRELAAYYGSDVVYSRVHEFGMPSRGLPARPGLQNTLDATARQIERIMGDDIQKEIR